MNVFSSRFHTNGLSRESAWFGFSNRIFCTSKAFTILQDAKRDAPNMWATLVGHPRCLSNANPEWLIEAGNAILDGRTLPMPRAADNANIHVTLHGGLARSKAAVHAGVRLL